MTHITIIILMLFGLLKGNNDKKFSIITEELKNQNDSIRFNALDKLEKLRLTQDQQIFSLNIAKEKFPSAKYDWETIPSLIIQTATKNIDAKLVEVIKANFKDYDTYAKNTSLSSLSNFDNIESIRTFKELIIKYPTEISSLSFGILNNNYSYKHIIFPDLLNVLDNEHIDSEILLLFLNYLNNNQIITSDYNSHIDNLLELSKKYRNIVEYRGTLNVDLWSDDTYQDARFKSGIIADILGNFIDKKVFLELTKYLETKDNKLKMFSVISLLKLKQEVKQNIINEIASDSETRNWFYDNLKSLNKENLFPINFKTQAAFAESDFANWLLYPTELGRIPDSLELMKVIQENTNSEVGIVEFYLFRFKSNHEDWIENGWMAGVSGYFPLKEKPSTNSYGFTFSSFEKWESKSQDEHIEDILILINSTIS